MAQHSMYGIGRVVIGMTWLFATACFFAPLATSSAGEFGRTLFWVLAIVHIVECVMFLGVLRRSGRPLVGELWQTFLFGIVHVSAVRAELSDEA